MTGMKLRFSIRDLFWLVVVAALAIGWYLDHRELTSYKISFAMPPGDPAVHED
jgi:hypothetical protein